MANFYSVPDSQLPTTGQQGDIYFATTSRTVWIVIPGGNLIPLNNLFAQRPVVSVGPPGPSGAAGATGQGLTWRGTYNPGNSYAPYDLVHFNGSAYICVKQVGANSGNDPTNSEYWNLISSEGADGQSFNWRGQWSLDNSYAHADTVIL